VHNGIRGPTCVVIVVEELISQALVNIVAEESSSSRRRVKTDTEQAKTHMQQKDSINGRQNGWVELHYWFRRGGDGCFMVQNQNR
jgi:hypothetical protein